jgi:serralysin
MPTIIGNDSNETLRGSSGDDLIDGGDGNDQIITSDGEDTVLGGEGDDQLNIIAAGPGLWQNYRYYPSTGRKIMSGGNGSDYVLGGADSDNLSGDTGNDGLYGMAGDDTLQGGSHDDWLDGGPGSDILDGGPGADVFAGGDGDDVYFMDNFLDKIRFDSGGNDKAIVSASFVKVGSDIEQVVYEAGALPLPYWIDSITNGSARIDAANRKMEGPVYFGFPETTSERVKVDGFTAIPESDRLFVRSFLAQLSTIINLTFVETRDAAKLEAGASLIFIGAALSAAVGGTASGNTVTVNKDWLAKSGSKDIYTHEIGHVLGLKHPFGTPDAVGNIGAGPYLPSAEDNKQWSVMSYTWTGHDENSFSPFDIASLQYLFGVSTVASNGNTLHSVSRTQANFIWDDTGVDILDASAQDVPVTLYLESGRWGYVGNKASLISAPGQVTINFGSTIENLSGGHASDMLVGSSSNNTIEGGGGNDTIAGGDGNDLLVGGWGDDTLNGASGYDHAVFNADRSGYELRKVDAGTYIVKATVGSDGNDLLLNVERLEFRDVNVAIDLAGSAGTVAKFLGAVFGKALVMNQEYVGVGLYLIEMGMSEQDLMQLAINARLGLGASNRQVVDLLYTNVTGTAPDEASALYFVDLLEDHTYTVASLGMLAAETDLNKTNIDLVGLMQTGLPYTEYSG